LSRRSLIFKQKPFTMASNPVANRVRSDSAFDDVESISKTFVTAQSFCTAVSLFASENGIQDLTKLLEVLPRRDNDIKSRDAAILDLQARLDAQEESHKTDTQKQMSNFENRYAVWSKANTILQNEISELRKASQERETELMQLRQELEVGKRRIEDVETRLRERIETSKAKDQQIVELKSRLQSALLDADSQREELKLSHGQMAVLESTLEQKEEKYKTVHDTARKRRETIQKFEEFSVTMNELDIPVM
jgi:chromosome segregation ATPase